MKKILNDNLPLLVILYIGGISVLMTLIGLVGYCIAPDGTKWLAERAEGVILLKMGWSFIIGAYFGFLAYGLALLNIKK